jgi:putative hydrolase of the HAD superfamily
MADHYRRIGYSRWEGLWGPIDADDRGLGQLYEYAPDYRASTWSNALADFGIFDSALVAQMIAAFNEERLARVVPYPDAVEVLEALAGRYRLGVVTDGSPAVQRAKLAISGLDRYFRSVAVSGEVGACKPDPAGFRKVLAELGAAPEYAAMIGNNAARDVLGAAGLGLYSVWVRRDGWPPGDVLPDAEITALSELLALF